MLDPRYLCLHKLQELQLALVSSESAPFKTLVEVEKQIGSLEQSAFFRRREMNGVHNSRQVRSFVATRRPLSTPLSQLLAEVAG